MLVYILKSIACLAILFVFYKVFLEKENMHKFKRFYLLGTLLFSMIIPSLVFTEYVVVEPEPMVTELTPVIIQQAEYSNDVINVPQALETDIIDITPILWGVYFIGLFFFGLKFLRNLFQIYRRIRKNPKQKLSRFTQVLLQEKITPHTFFSYIFLNKKKFETDQIPAEVLLHEQTHASQKHSWDVILVELLHVIFWINPFIYLTKKAIRLNHEFLADQAVLKENIDQSTYQNTLLSYLSPDSEKKYQPLANAINYSSIKKRFTVMKTHTSKKAVLLRSLLLLPLLAVLFISFSETNLIEVEQERYYESELQEVSSVEKELKKINALPLNYTDNNSVESLKNALGVTDEISVNSIYEEGLLIAETIDVHINKAGQILVQDQLVEIDNALKTLSKYNSDLSREEKSKIVDATVHVEAGAPQDMIERLEEILTEYGAATIDIAEWNNSKELERIWITIMNDDEIWVKDKKVQLDDLAAKISDISSAQGLKDNLKIQIYSEETLHQNFLNKISKEIDKVGASSIQVFTEEYIMPENEYQDKIDRRKAQVHLKANKMSFEKKSATKEQLVNYNTLAKKYNTILSKKHTARNIDIRILKDGNYLVDGIKINKNQLTTTVNTLHQDITQEIRNDIMNIHVSSSSEISKKEVWYIFNSLNDYGFYRIITPNQEVVKGKGNKPFKIIDSVNKILQEKESATPEQIREYDALAKKYNSMLSKSKRIQIKMKDVERLEYIYSLMSKKQKADAERYPDFPEPPKVIKGEASNIPPPKEPKAPKAPKVLKGEVSNIPPPPKEPKAPKVLKGKANNQDIYGDGNVRVYQHNVEEFKTASPNLMKSLESLAKRGAQFYFEGKKVSTKEGLLIVKNEKNILIETHPYVNKKPEVRILTTPTNVSIPEPPAPPEPVSPLDHVIEMAKKNAVFYLEGKEITSDKAIEVMKKNKNINIDSRSANDEQPVVKMSTKPIRIN